MTTHSITLTEQDVLNTNPEISTSVLPGDTVCYALARVPAAGFSFHEDTTAYVNSISSSDRNAASYITAVQTTNNAKTLQFVVSASAQPCSISFNLQVQNLGTGQDWEVDPLIVIGNPPN